MPVWLLEHKSPRVARDGGEVFERIVVRAKNRNEARDLAIAVSPVPALDPRRDSVWGDPRKTNCELATDGDNRILAAEIFGSPRAH